MPLLATERHDRILGRLRRDGTVSVAQIAEDCAVTAETVRRDLDRLARDGVLQRVHGGAVAASNGSHGTSRAESSWRDRQSHRAPQKRAVAAAAMEFVPDSTSSSLIFDAGSTTEMLVDLLVSQAPAPAASAQPRYVLTDAVPIAGKLADVEGFDVETLGGRVRRLTGAVVGDAALQTLADRRCDVAFLGTNGIDASFGLSTPDPAEAAVKSAMIAAARTVVLLADSTKLDRCSLVRFAHLEEVSVLITDADPQPPLRDALQTAGVTVIRAAAP